MNKNYPKSSSVHRKDNCDHGNDRFPNNQLKSM